MAVLPAFGNFTGLHHPAKKGGSCIHCCNQSGGASTYTLQSHLCPSITWGHRFPMLKWTHPWAITSWGTINPGYILWCMSAMIVLLTHTDNYVETKTATINGTGTAPSAFHNHPGLLGIEFIITRELLICALALKQVAPNVTEAALIMRHLPIVVKDFVCWMILLLLPTI